MTIIDCMDERVWCTIGMMILVDFGVCRLLGREGGT